MDLLDILARHNQYLEAKLQEAKDNTAKLQAELSNSIGYAHPSRAIVEYALSTQEGSVLNIKKAEKEFFSKIYDTKN